MQKPPAEVSVMMMTQVEAKAAVNQIKDSLDSAGRLAFDLRKREGWKALGYESWAECAKAEFGKSLSHINKAIATEEFRETFTSSHASNGIIANISNRAIEPLLPHHDAPEIISEAVARAAEMSGDKSPTAKQVKEAVDAVLADQGLAMPATAAGGASSSNTPRDRYQFWETSAEDVFRFFRTLDRAGGPEAICKGWTPKQKEAFAEVMKHFVERCNKVMSVIRKGK